VKFFSPSPILIREN